MASLEKGLQVVLLGTEPGVGSREQRTKYTGLHHLSKSGSRLKSHLKLRAAFILTRQGLAKL